MHLCSHLHRPNTKSHISDIGEYQPVVSQPRRRYCSWRHPVGVWLALSQCAKRLMDHSDLHPWHSSCSHALVLWNQNLAARIFTITNKRPLDFCAHWVNNRLGHKLNYVTCGWNYREILHLISFSFLKHKKCFICDQVDYSMYENYTRSSETQDVV